MGERHTPYFPEWVGPKRTGTNSEISRPLFEGGQVLASPLSMRLIEAAGADLRDMLSRHLQGDWGAVNELESFLNDLALSHGELLRSIYQLPDGGEIWVTTTKERDQTFFELPDEADQLY